MRLSKEYLKGAETIYEGKTKRVCSLREEVKVLVEFKDEVTGHRNGTIDPGGDFVVGKIKDSGTKNMKITLRFFSLLRQVGLPLPEVEEVGTGTLKMDKLEMFPIEVICRNRATGSFVRRYKGYVEEGKDLGGLIEFTLKDDGLGDPLITEEALIKLDILKKEEIEEMKRITSKVNRILNEFLSPFGAEVIDFKLEFGKDREEDLLIGDELSAATARFRYKEGRTIDQDELLKILEGIKDDSIRVSPAR